MKQAIKKKLFLSEQQKQERKTQERIETQNEILKNRSEGLQQWTKEHASAEIIFDCIMNALDYVPKEHKKFIVHFLRMPIFEFNHNYTEYLACEDEIDDLDAVFEMLREIHDISAKEVGLESYKEYSENFYKEVKKERAKRRRSVKKEVIEPYKPDTSDETSDIDLPF
jgi:hypothetical protein